MSVHWYLMAKGKGGGYKTASGPIVSINDALAAPLRSLRVGIDPVQAGTGDPSPDNVRPISGWDEANVWRTGRNLLKIDASNILENQRVTVAYTDSGITVVAKGTYAYESHEIRNLIIGQTYTVSLKGKSTGEYNKVYLVNADTGSGLGIGFSLNGTEKTYTRTFTATSKRLYFNFYVTAYGTTGTMTIEDFQLELGSTPTPYTPYTGNQFTIQLGQTVYGGTLDVLSGVLTVDRANIASYNGETLPGKWISDRDVYAPGTTPTIGAQVVYELATPITIPLSDITISTLKGQNVVWADCGDVTVEYLSAGGANPDLMKLAVAFMGR